MLTSFLTLTGWLHIVVNGKHLRGVTPTQMVCVCDKKRLLPNSKVAAAVR